MGNAAGPQKPGRQAAGYLYGETWRSVDNPRVFVVLSVWGGLEHWQGWVNNEFCRKMDERINRRLGRPSVAKVFEEVTTFQPPGIPVRKER